MGLLGFLGGAAKQIGKGTLDAAKLRGAEMGLVAGADDDRPLLTRLASSQLGRHPAAMPMLGALDTGTLEGPPLPAPMAPQPMRGARLSPRPNTMDRVVNPSFDIGYFERGTYPWSERPPVVVPYLPTDETGHATVQMQAKPGETIFVQPEPRSTGVAPGIEALPEKLPEGSKLRAGVAFLLGRANPAAWAESLERSAFEKRQQAYYQVLRDTLARAGNRELMPEERNRLAEIRSAYFGTNPDYISPREPGRPFTETFYRLGKGDRREQQVRYYNSDGTLREESPWINMDAPPRARPRALTYADERRAMNAEVVREDFDRIGREGLREIIRQADPGGEIDVNDPDAFLQALLMNASQRSQPAYDALKRLVEAYGYQPGLDTSPEKWRDSRRKFIDTLFEESGYVKKEGEAAPPVSALDAELEGVQPAAPPPPLVPLSRETHTAPGGTMVPVLRAPRVSSDDAAATIERLLMQPPIALEDPRRRPRGILANIGG